MIPRTTKRLWGGVFLAASASLVFTSAVLPVLDQEFYQIGQVIEAEHDASTCAVAHNHALCMVWAGGKLLPGVAESDAPAFPALVAGAVGDSNLSHRAPTSLPTRSRAPPVL